MTSSPHPQPLFDLTKFEIYLKYTEAEKVNICKAVNMHFTSLYYYSQFRCRAWHWQAEIMDVVPCDLFWNTQNSTPLH